MTAPLGHHPAIPGLTDPSADRTEQAILGYAIFYGNMDDLLAADVEVDDFRAGWHRSLWLLMLDSHSRGLPVQLAALADMVTDWTPYRPPNYPEETASLYVELLRGLGPVPADLVRYVRLLKMFRGKREVKQALAQSAQRIADGEDVETVTADTYVRLSAAQESYNPTVETTEVINRRLYDKLHDEAEGKAIQRIRTGLYEWDEEEAWQGISARGMTLIIAASSVGKSSVIMRLAFGVAAGGLPVMVHCTESGRDEYLEDVNFALSRSNASRWEWVCRRLRELGPGEGSLSRERLATLRSVESAIDKTDVLPMVVSGAGKTVENICAKATKHHRAGECGCLFVDYLQDIPDSTGPGLRRGDRVQQVGHKSNMLKELAAKLKIPVLVGAQASGEKPRGAFVPNIYDVQWSSTAHQDAEEVYALFRPAYYMGRDVLVPPDLAAPPGSDGEYFDIVTRKRRRGSLGKIRVPFDPPTRWVGGPWPGFNP